MDFASIRGAPRSSLRYSTTRSARQVPALQTMAFPMGSWGLVALALWNRPPGQHRGRRCWTSGGCLRSGGPVQGQRQKDENLQGCPRHCQGMEVMLVLQRIRAHYLAMGKPACTPSSSSPLQP
uniref:Uncharacterized protein n=1 Tax=Arundo donax TaxID=35708 RepID=A0A0A9G115_ARUDO